MFWILTVHDYNATITGATHYDSGCWPLHCPIQNGNKICLKCNNKYNLIGVVLVSFGDTFIVQIDLNVGLTLARLWQNLCTFELD